MAYHNAILQKVYFVQTKMYRWAVSTESIDFSDIVETSMAKYQKNKREFSNHVMINLHFFAISWKGRTMYLLN